MWVFSLHTDSSLVFWALAGCPEVQLTSDPVASPAAPPAHTVGTRESPVPLTGQLPAGSRSPSGTSVLVRAAHRAQETASYYTPGSLQKHKDAGVRWARCGRALNTSSCAHGVWRAPPSLFVAASAGPDTVQTSTVGIFTQASLRGHG